MLLLRTDFVQDVSKVEYPLYCVFASAASQHGKREQCWSIGNLGMQKRAGPWAKVKSGCLPFRISARSDATCLRIAAGSGSVAAFLDTNPPPTVVRNEFVAAELNEA